MSAHTPGPWEVVEPVTTGEYVRIIGGIDGDADDEGRPVSIYTHVCDVIDNKDERANARLIAQAPALAAFVRRVAEYSDYTHDEVSELQILQQLQHDAQVLLAEVER